MTWASRVDWMAAGGGTAVPRPGVVDRLPEPDLTRLTTKSGSELNTLRALICEMNTERGGHGGDSGPFTNGAVTTPGRGVTLRSVGSEEGVSLDDTRSHTGQRGRAKGVRARHTGADTTVHSSGIWLAAPRHYVERAPVVARLSWSTLSDLPDVSPLVAPASLTGRVVLLGRRP